MRKPRILVVDDDHDILDLLKYNLEREGFQVHTVDKSVDAIDECESFRPELVILDIMMPEVNGIELCRQIRAVKRFQDTFIFFLTARSESYFQDAALKVGGDDFIEKIFGLRTLTARIKAVLKRRLVIRKRLSVIRLGDLQIDIRSGSVKLGGKEIQLTKPELDLLYFFAQNPKKVISVESLSPNLLGSGASVLSNSIENYLDNLIGKLGGRWLYKMGEGKYKILAKSRVIQEPWTSGHNL